MSDHFEGDAATGWSALQTPEDRAIEARLAPVRAVYVESPRDDAVRAALDRLVRRAVEGENARILQGAKPVEGRALIIVGESGAGKTTLMHRALRTHPAFPGYGAEGCGFVVSLSIRAPCSLANLGADLLRATGYPKLPGRDDARIVLPLVRQHLARTGARLIVIDEVHALTRAKNSIELAKIQDLFRSLLNDPVYPVQMIFAGTDAALVGLNDEDGQLMRRADVLRLEPIGDDDDHRVVRLIRKFARAADLDLSREQAARIAPRLIHATRGRLGLIIELTIDAIEQAFRCAAELSVERFAEVYARRTAATAAKNPFVGRDWRTITITNVVDNT